MSIPYHFSQNARSRTLILTLVAVWIVLLGLWLIVDAALWVLAFLAAFTLPGLWDLWANPSAGFSLEQDEIRWHTGRRRGSLGLDEIDHIRLDTRLDFSVRATAVLHTGRKIKLPFECTPPHQELEDALQAHGLRTERHHFNLLQ